MAHEIDFHEAVATLRRGEVVAFPTETVFGLGARIDSLEGIASIYALKGRPTTNPLIVHCSSTEQALMLCTFGSAQQEEWFRRLSHVFWPGALTVVVPASVAVPRELTAGLDSVGLRIPACPIALRLIEEVGVPIAAPSANTSNYLSPTHTEHILDDFRSVPLPVLAGNPSVVGLESTVLSLLGEAPAILREGAITAEHIQEQLGTFVRCAAQQQSGELRSPGLLPKHYSPRTPFRVCSLESLKEISVHGRGVLLSCFPLPESVMLPENVASEVLSPSKCYEEAGAQFYAALHRLDEQQFNEILFFPCENEGIGRAINDRARRAAGSTP